MLTLWALAAPASLLALAALTTLAAPASPAALLAFASLASLAASHSLAALLALAILVALASLVSLAALAVSAAPAYLAALTANLGSNASASFTLTNLTFLAVFYFFKRLQLHCSFSKSTIIFFSCMQFSFLLFWVLCWVEMWRWGPEGAVISGPGWREQSRNLQIYKNILHTHTQFPTRRRQNFYTYFLFCFRSN
jgi:hypothetical protein